MAGLQLFKENLIENKILFISKINLVLLGLLLMLTFAKLKPLFIPESSGLISEAPKIDFCSLSMNQMIQKKLSPHLIKEGLYELVTKNKYEALLLDGEESIAGIWSNENMCKVLLKTNNGLRSFDFFLSQSTDFKFFYQIQKIRENELF